MKVTISIGEPLDLGDRIRTKAQLMMTVFEKKHPVVKNFTPLINWIDILEYKTRLNDNLAMDVINFLRFMEEQGELNETMI